MGHFLVECRPPYLNLYQLFDEYNAYYARYSTGLEKYNAYYARYVIGTIIKPEQLLTYSEYIVSNIFKVKKLLHKS